MDGIIKKTQKNSFILSFHVNSGLARTLFTDSPTYNGGSVIVLQVMNAADNWVICEVVRTMEG